jgi:predicted RNA-binding Zn-ribbon protein involved in translation (DUF1610 family)
MEIQTRDPKPINRDPVHAPDVQRLKPMQADVCAKCNAINSFRAYSTRENHTHYRCKKCGQTATRMKCANC